MTSSPLPAQAPSLLVIRIRDFEYFLTMKTKTKKIFLYSVLGVILFFSSLLGFLYIKYPPESWKGLIVQQLEQTLQTKIEIEAISYGLDGSLKIQGVSVYTKPSPDKDEKPDLFIVELGLLFHPGSIWKQKLEIYSLRLWDMRLKLIQKNKKYNWEKNAFDSEYFKKSTN